MTPLHIIVIGVLGLIGIGLYGLLITRNLIKVVVALQVLVKGALLALVAAGTVSGKINLGQSLAVMVIVVDTVVAVIGLALALQVKRRMGTLDVKELATLKK
jgi:NADH:ubiquinone oxidoreductase subunit K